MAPMVRAGAEAFRSGEGAGNRAFRMLVFFFLAVSVSGCEESLLDEPGEPCPSVVELPGYIEDQPVEACADVAGKLVQPDGGWIEGAWVRTEYTDDVYERANLTVEGDVTLFTGDFRFRILRYPSRPPKPPVSPDTITILLEAGRGGIQSVPRDTTAVTVEFAPAGEVPPVSTVIFESDEFD